MRLLALAPLMLVLMADAVVLTPHHPHHNQPTAMAAPGTADEVFNLAVQDYRADQMQRARCQQIASMLQSSPSYPVVFELRSASKAYACR